MMEKKMMMKILCFSSSLFAGDGLSLMSIMLSVMMISSPISSFRSFKGTFVFFDTHLPGEAAVWRAKGGCCRCCWCRC